jgi:hypothetical protein
MNKMIQNISRLIIAFGVLRLAFCFSGCTKLIETPPPSESIAESNVYTIDATAISVLNGIYISMNANGQPFQGNRSIAFLSGLSVDELTLYRGFTSGLYYSYYTNNLSQALGTATISGGECWSPLYNYIFRCNAAIEGLHTSTSLTPGIKPQLLGEAMFLRAFYYFYLVNLYGDVPLALTTDPEVNTLLSRSPKSAVYEQIIADLLEAEELLSTNFLNGTLTGTTTERVRPTRWAATALLARIYLYTGDWANAEAKATEVINYNTLFSLLPLNNVFLKNSKEAIWQLQPTAITFNTQEAQTMVIPQTGPTTATNPVYLSKNLLNSFETGDRRAVYGNWIDTTIYKINATLKDTVAYVNKYKFNLQDATITTNSGTTNMKEYFMVFRLGEQYLIRAEARAQQGNISGSHSDVNDIRNRAFLIPKPVTVGDKTELLAAILHERQVELFCEWGHRWLDLKRTGKIDEMMKDITPLKAKGVNVWKTYQQMYPLPLVSDIQRGPNLLQNEGY